MSRYLLRLCEQEVQIRFDMEEKIAHIYASAPNWIAKYDKMVEEFPEHYKCVKVDELGYYKKYECPIKMMLPRKPRILTDEQKARIVARFKKAPETGEVFEANDSDEDSIDQED